MVKNGSNARARICGGMPRPWSVTEISTKSPAPTRPSASASVPSTERLRVPTRIASPTVPASCAFIARFRIMRSIWVRSTSAGHRLGCSTASTVTPPPIAAGNRPRSSATTALRSVERGSNRWRRANASSCRVRSPPRSAASRMAASRAAVRGSRGMPPASPVASRNSMLPMMTVSRLLKSCATPEVSWPTASMRSVLASRASVPARSATSCARRRSASSRRSRSTSRAFTSPSISVPLPTQCRIVPAASATGSTRVRNQRWRPSRWRSRCSSSSGARSACARSHSRSTEARSSGCSRRRS